ncbi:MAG: DUF349 domain-containing protein [Bacteroidales bacterium]|jgi:hypothetical protein|nr:DUF349 domain-containing protein [Bacteroidales bacterium]
MDNLTNPQLEELKKEENVELKDVLNDKKNTEVSNALPDEEILNVAEEEDVHEEENVAELVANYAQMSMDELYSEMKKLYDASNFEQLKAKASLIRNAFNNLSEQKNKATLENFIKEGGNAVDFKPKETSVEIDFANLYNSYKNKRQKYLEDQEKEKQENLNKKQAILEELRLLLDSDGSLKEIYDAFNSIQERWKEIGQVPRMEINTLWENYHFLIEKFYDKVKISKELRDLDMKKNLDTKIDLCEKVEALMFEKSITKSFHALQEYHQQWKETGPVPSDKNTEIWERFKTASDQINARRKEFYEQRLAEMEINLKAKTELCEKIEDIIKQEITLVKDWIEKTNEVNDLLKLWRSIGGVAKKDSEVLWTRFKGSIDTFFAKKKDTFDKLKKEYLQHYNEKVEICVKAEAIALRNDWKKATNELLELQKQWKDIGYIPKEKAEKLWLRFRKSCDTFFAKKQEAFNQYRLSEEENIAKKKKLIEEVKAFEFTEDKERNLNSIKDFQRRWFDIGYISAETGQKLWHEFQAAVNFHFDKIREAYRNLDFSNFNAKLATTNTNAAKRSINEQIDKLQKELNLWENNLGFLAKSKSADALRAEYEKKLEKIRQQIALLQVKLKAIKNEKPEQKTKENIEETSTDTAENKE